MEPIVLEFHKKNNKIYSQLDGHCHTVYEIYYFISGDADIMVEGKMYPLSPHTLFIIAPNVLHGIRVNSKADYIRNVLFISPDSLLPERRHLLTGILPHHKKVQASELLYEHTEEYHLDQFFESIHQLENEPEDVRDMLMPIFCEALLSQIYLLVHSLKPATFINQMPEKVMEIITFLNAHLTEPQTLDSVADHFFISKNYLNSNFKRYLGTTVMDYIRYKRVILARQAIKSGESAMDAALQSGFSDYSSFYRAYVKYEGASPRTNMSTKSQHTSKTNGGSNLTQGTLGGYHGI